MVTTALVVFAEVDHHFRHLQEIPICERDVFAPQSDLFQCYGGIPSCKVCLDTFLANDPTFPDACTVTTNSCYCPECETEEIAFLLIPNCSGEGQCGDDKVCDEAAFCNFDLDTHGSCECCDSIIDCKNNGLPFKSEEQCVEICGEKTAAPTISSFPTSPPQPCGPPCNLLNCYTSESNIGTGLNCWLFF